MHKFYLLLIWLAAPGKLLAIPSPIADILSTFEGKKKPIKKKKKLLSDGNEKEIPSDNVPVLSNAQKARIAIDKAIKEAKLARHPATWYYRGVIYDRLLRDHIVSEEAPTLLNEALDAYQQTKKLSLPKSQFYSFALSNLAALWRYFLNRGIGYYRQELPDQSLAQFTICRRILPEEATPLLYMAIVYHSNDEPEKALRCYEDYIQTQGAQFAVFRAMAAIHYHKLKNFDKAIALLNEALMQFPFNNELLEEKCLIYEAAGKEDDYFTDLAIGLAKKEVHACYAYAYFLEYQGRTQEAVEYYHQIVKDHPGQYDTLRQIGFLFYNEAIKLCTHALKLTGSNEQLKDGILTNLLRVMQVTVKPLSVDSIGWIRHAIPLSLWSVKRIAFKPSLLSDTLTWNLYSHPLCNHKQIEHLAYLHPMESIPCTSSLYGYIHQKAAAILGRNKWLQAQVALEKYLQEAVHYLSMARKQDKKDKAVTQALYYSYYYLKKHRSAYRLFQMMEKHKQYLEEDPFLGNQEKD